jgi:hypothetical protein
VSVPALTAVLQDAAEHRMVRHEAAEALGAVGGEEVEAVLKVRPTAGWGVWRGVWGGKGRLSWLLGT